MADTEPQVLLLLGQIDGKVSSLMETSRSTNKRVDDLDERLTILETAQSKRSGATGVVLAAGGFGAGIIANYLGPILSFFKGHP
jgi:hypothetical protein